MILNQNNKQTAILFSIETILSVLSHGCRNYFYFHSLEKFLSASQLLIGNSTSATSTNNFAQEVLLAWTGPGRMMVLWPHWACPHTVMLQQPIQLSHVRNIPSRPRGLSCGGSSQGREQCVPQILLLGDKDRVQISISSPGTGCCWGQMDVKVKPGFWT